MGIGERAIEGGMLYKAPVKKKAIRTLHRTDNTFQDFSSNTTEYRIILANTSKTNQTKSTNDISKTYRAQRKKAPKKPLAKAPSGFSPPGAPRAPRQPGVLLRSSYLKGLGLRVLRVLGFLLAFG